MPEVVAPGSLPTSVAGENPAGGKSGEKQKYAQESAYHSPHSLQRRVGMLFFGIVWRLLCAWTPKPLKRWRLIVLRAFGTTIYGRPFVHPGARIHYPANLILHDHACLGDGAVAYTQGVIEIRAGATVAQEVYLCTGTHDLEDPNIPLVTAPIVIKENAFIGVRALILPGVTIGRDAVVGAGSVVTKDVPDGMVAAGNPCRVIRPRGSAVPAEQTVSQ